ncbi:helix-turn-helix domain-containing protein [Lacticaseibacillus suihuaensis]
MTEAIAYRLKQIMTAEHLSLTQAAKLIGISPSSMRKVLKDTPMSRPIMFKINRFIEAHPVAPAEHTFTIFDSEAAEKNATPGQPDAKPATAAAQNAAQPDAKQTPAQPAASQTKRQTAQPKQAKAESKDAKAQPKQAAKTQAKAESKDTKAQPKQAAKTQAKAESKDTKAQPKQAAKTQTKAESKDTKAQPKQAAKTQAKAENKDTKAQAKQAAKTQAKGDQAKAAKAQSKQAKGESKTATQSKQAKTQTAKPNDQPKATKAQNQQTKQAKASQAKQAQTTAAAPKQQAQAEQPKANRNAPQQAAKNPVGSLEPGAQQANFEATRKAQLADQTPAKTAPAAAEQATAQPTPAADTKRKPGRPKSTKTGKTGDQAKHQGGKQNEQPKQQQAAKQNEQPKQQQAAKQNDQPKQQQAAKQNEQPKQQQAAKQNEQPKQQQAVKQNDQPKQQAAKQNDQPKQQAAKQNDQPKQQASQPNTPQQPAKPAAKPRPSSTTLQVFMDESFGGGSDYQRNMSIGATVIDPADDHALDSFTNTLYPFGWQPGDEVKARGKSSAQIQAMMAHALDPAVKVYTVYSPLSDAGNFSMSFGVMYPYVAALLRIIDAQPVLPQKVRVTLDQRSEIATEQLGLAARMLHAYLKSQTGREISFFFRTADSKNTIGVQYSDFASHAAMFFTAAQMQTAGMVRLADIGAELGDQLTLYAMVGLQKYLLDERPTAVVPTSGFKSPILNIAMRLFNLASKAATMTQVPEDAFVQAKLVINQLLTITPSSVNGAINKMPFQNWYDMAARASSLLHYTDATLPQFSIDPDALKVAEDALNNVATLLAGGR